MYFVFLPGKFNKTSSTIVQLSNLDKISVLGSLVRQTSFSYLMNISCVIACESPTETPCKGPCL